MLKKFEKILFEMPEKQTITKTVLFWILYFSVILGINKLVFSITESERSPVRIIVFLIIVMLFLGGVFSVLINAAVIIASGQLRKEEKRHKEIIKEVENLFAESVKREVTILELSDLAESSIVNELEANEEICLFAELDINRINISIKMKDGKEYPGVISYLPAKYEVFLKEFEVL